MVHASKYGKISKKESLRKDVLKIELKKSRPIFPFFSLSSNLGDLKFDDPQKGEGCNNFRGTVSKLDRKKILQLGDFVTFHFLLLDIVKLDVFLSDEP